MNRRDREAQMRAAIAQAHIVRLLQAGVIVTGLILAISKGPATLIAAGIAVFILQTAYPKHDPTLYRD